jgi:transcriptional regulator with XRE-family HTH domain
VKPPADAALAPIAGPDAPEAKQIYPNTDKCCPLYGHRGCRPPFSDYTRQRRQTVINSGERQQEYPWKRHFSAPRVVRGSVMGWGKQSMDSGNGRNTVQAARIDQHVGDKIRRRRTLLGFTQEQLGESLAISYQQIQKYETGANRISAGRLFQIAQRLDVPVSYFFDGLDTHAVAASTGNGNGHGNGNGNGNGAAARTTIELVRNFNAIMDPNVRTAVSSLVKSLSVTLDGDRNDGDDASAFGQFASGGSKGRPD